MYPVMSGLHPQYFSSVILKRPERNAMMRFDFCDKYATCCGRIIRAGFDDM